MPPPPATGTIWVGRFPAAGGGGGVGGGRGTAEVAVAVAYTRPRRTLSRAGEPPQAAAAAGSWTMVKDDGYVRARRQLEAWQE